MMTDNILVLKSFASEANVGIKIQKVPNPSDGLIGKGSAVVIQKGEIVEPYAAQDGWFNVFKDGSITPEPDTLFDQLRFREGNLTTLREQFSNSMSAVTGDYLKKLRFLRNDRFSNYTFNMHSEGYQQRVILNTTS